MYCVKTLETSIAVPQRQEAKPPLTDGVNTDIGSEKEIRSEKEYKSVINAQ